MAPSEGTLAVGDGNGSRRAAALVLAATAIVFGPGVVGDFVWDDIQLITSNAYIRDPSRWSFALTHGFWHTSSVPQLPTALALHYYRPVVTLAYGIEFQLFGEHPLGYHLVNLALHLGCVALAFAWLRRRLGGAGEAASLAATVGAALFALHPSRPESVTWISGSTDLWMALWALLGLAAWDRRDDLGTGLAALAFGLAVLSKEPGLLLPFILLADAVLLPGCRGRLGRAALLCATTAAAFGARVVVGAGHPAGGGALSLRATVPRVLSSLGHYVVLVFWPVPPSVQVAVQTYDPRGVAVYSSTSLALGALAATGLGALALAAWRQPRARPWLADTLWFVGLLAPALNLLALGTDVLVAARFLYLPMLGVAALVARALAPAFAAGVRGRLTAGVGAAGVLVAASAVSVGHIGHLLTDEDLWTWECAIAPDNPAALHNLLLIRSRERRYGETFDLVRRGLVASRTHGMRGLEIEFGLLGASMAVSQAHDADQAALARVRDFLDGLAVPGHTSATLDLPQVHVELSLSEPERDWVTHLVDPYRLTRASAHARTLDFPAAEQQLEGIVAEEPRTALAWRNLLLVYAAEQRWGDALRAGDRGLRLLPDERVVALLRDRVARAGDLLARTTAPIARAEVLGGLYIDLAERELARRTLDEALARFPGAVTLTLLRARADSMDGQLEAARARLVAARVKDPLHTPWWNDALRQLATPRRP